MDVRLRIDQDTGSVTAVMMWHPINGVWTHIAQMFDGENIKYLINGTEITDLPVLSEEAKDVMEKLKADIVAGPPIVEGDI